MPEVPEVTYMVDKIRKEYENVTLKRITLISGRYMRNIPRGFNYFKSSKMKVINNKGKFIYIILANGQSLWITLGLTGELSREKNKYTRIKFNTNYGSFYLNDMRNFGTFSIHTTNESLDRKLRKLGPDPLTYEFTYNSFIRSLDKQNKNQNIGNVLMKQDFIAGIGNYLRAEVLYLAGISPYCKLRNIPEWYYRQLYLVICKEVLRVYTRQKKKGLYANYFRVYRQSKDPKGRRVIGEKFKNNRTMWWSPKSVKLEC